MRWNDDLVTASGTCTPESFAVRLPPDARCERRTLMLAPRVDECRCNAGTPVATHHGVLYVGLDDAGRARWQRVHHAGRPGGSSLVGAQPTGLVFDDHEVWSPSTGLTVLPATPSDRLAGRGCWVPEARAFLEADLDVTLVRTRGGLYLRPAAGPRTLVLPVERKLLGFYDVEDLAPVPGTSLVLVGERFEVRGPGSVRFSILDLASRKVVFRHELDPHHLVGPVRVIAGPEGHLGLSYLDEHTGEYVLHHYRWSR